EIFETLKEINTKNLEGWVIASLNPTFSNIPIDTWYSIQHNTNIAESNHVRVNHHGTILCL
ncbi:41356_t:CDS:2, partial [Gigaspora margarita]